MGVLKSIMPRFVSKPWHYGFQYSHNATDGNLENMHANIHKKGEKNSKPCDNVKMPRPPRDYGKPWHFGPECVC